MPEEDPLTGEPAPPPGPARRDWRRYVITRGAALLGAAVIGIFAAILLLDSQIGHRFVIDRIVELSPRSGLKIEVGRMVYAASAECGKRTCSYCAGLR